MESKVIKCTSKDHENKVAILYCQECQIYICNICEKIHSGLCRNHNTFKLTNDIKDIFTGFCKEENHINKLEYYCKEHNKLCCGLCISKIEGKGNGKHNNCNICFIEDIKEEKKKKLNDNIKYLEELSKTIEESINKLKTILEEINKEKEEIKENIQKTFTKIRNEINKREDSLLSEVDKQFDTIYFKEELVKEAEKLPKKVKISLENSKKANNEWNDNNKISSIINDCILIENNIKEMDIVNECVKKNNEINKILIFNKEEKEMADFMNKIKQIGKLEIKEGKPNNKSEEDIDFSDLTGFF